MDKVLNEREVDSPRFVNPLGIARRFPSNKNSSQIGLVKYDEFQSGGDVITRWKKTEIFIPRQSMRAIQDSNRPSVRSAR